MSAEADTSAEAHAAQIGAYRRMSGEQRLLVGLRMSDEAREIARAGVRARHPAYSDEQVDDAVRVLYLGRALFEAAWPGRPVLAP